MCVLDPYWLFGSVYADRAPCHARAERGFGEGSPSVELVRSRDSEVRQRYARRLERHGHSTRSDSSSGRSSSRSSRHEDDDDDERTEWSPLFLFFLMYSNYHDSCNNTLINVLFYIFSVCFIRSRVISSFSSFGRSCNIWPISHLFLTNIQDRSFFSWSIGLLIRFFFSCKNLIMSQSNSLKSILSSLKPSE